MSTTLLSYNQEIVPKFNELAENKELLKEFMAADPHIQELLEEIKTAQRHIKEHCEDEKPALMREIKALTTDIGLACKSAAKGTQHKAQELKAFFAARAKQSVEKTVTKGELFAELDKEIG